jgi:hypothetical protein
LFGDFFKKLLALAFDHIQGSSGGGAVQLHSAERRYASTAL